jgi:hypothetical protein
MPRLINRPRLRAWSQNVALLAGGVVFALFAAEVGVRILTPQQLVIRRPDVWAPDSGLGWVRRPNISTTINTGNGPVEVHSDPRGYRTGRSGPSDAPRRILLLGDSFMEALQVDYESSTAGLLEVSLARALGEPIAIRNAAVGGWDPNQYHIQLRRSLATEQFELALVVLYLGNDVVNREREWFPPRPPRARPAFRVPRGPADVWPALAAPVGAVLEPRSQLYQMVAGSWRIARRRAGKGSPGTPDYLRKSEATSERWAVTGTICDRLARDAASEGVPVLFVLIPPVERILGDLLTAQARHDGHDVSTLDPDQPVRLLGNELRRRELPVLDLTPALAQAASQGVAVYGRVDRHFTAAGHEVTAAALLPHVAATMRETPTTTPR